MGTILNESDRAAIDSRVRSLSVSSSARWGSMDVAGMLRHLRLASLMALGEYSVPSANKRVFQVFPLKHLILYVLPFPKGAPTAPALKCDAAASFEEERAALLEVLERIGTGLRDGMGTGSSAVWTTKLARMGRCHVQTHRPSSKAIRRVGI
jgi:hypothetical protein